MKLTTFLIAILILFSALKPCSDGANSHDEIETEMSHNHQDDSDDSCAAICVCICCGVPITLEINEIFPIAPQTEFSTITFSDYKNNYTHNCLEGIWQPPRLFS